MCTAVSASVTHESSLFMLWPFLLFNFRRPAPPLTITPRPLLFSLLPSDFPPFSFPPLLLKCRPWVFLEVETSSHALHCLTFLPASVS